MKQSDFDVLWNRVKLIEFDEPHVRFPFAHRLARDNGWFLQYAHRVMTEYKRFACLAVSGLGEMTPSDQVDQAWHQHLTFSRHYWGEWTDCLGQELHHGPTQGGTVEADRHLENYERTLSVYRELFRKPIPKDIWPDPQERFRNPERYVRLDTSKHVILKKPWAQ